MDPVLHPRQMKIQSVSEAEMDPEIRDKLQILLQKKAEAVEREDFDEAM